MFLRVVLAAVAAAALAWPAAAQAPKWTGFATDSTSGTKVFASETATELLLQIHGPTRMSVSFDVDVQADDHVSPWVDVEYGASKEGAICASYQLDEKTGASTFCRRFRSKATISREVVGDLTITKWAIPKGELSADGREFGYAVTFFDMDTSQRRKAKGYYRFGSGIVSKPRSYAEKTDQELEAAKPVSRQLYAQRLSDVVADGKVTIVVREFAAEKLMRRISARLTAAETNGCVTTLRSDQYSWTIDWRSIQDVFDDTDLNADDDLDDVVYVTQSKTQDYSLVMEGELANYLADAAFWSAQYLWDACSSK